MHRPARFARAAVGVQLSLIALILLLALPLLGNPRPSLAAQSATTTANLRLRSGPGTGYETILVMPAGSQVEVTGASINSFYPVIYQETVGYAHGAYLAFDAPDPVAGQRVSIDVALNLRAGPATTYAVLAVMPAGSEAVLTGEANGSFYRMTFNGMLGWAHRDYFSLIDEPPIPTPTNTALPPTLTPTLEPSNTPEPTLEPTSTTEPTLETTSTPGATSDATNTPDGTAEPSPTPSDTGEATQTPEATQTSLATETPTQTATPTATVTPEATVLARLNLRAGPSTVFPVITIMPVGAKVILLGETSSGFEKVQYETYTGWAYAAYLDMPDTGSGNDNTAQTTASLNLRAEPSTTAQVLLVMPAGSTVTITGGLQNGFLPVIYQGTAGWAYASYLSGSQVPLPEEALQLNILLYHRIGTYSGDYQVTAWQLEQQLAWLRSNGYETVTPRDLLAWLNNGVPLPPNPVMITIDDGNASDRLFKQLMDEYGFEGTWFMPNYTALTADELRTFHQEGEICGHTVSHPFLSQWSYGSQWAEIANNKTWLEQRTGAPVICFGYPFGDYNSTTVQVIIDAGYLMAFDAWGGTQVLTPSLNRWHIVRWNVYGRYTLADFARLMS